ncbi:MAG TPA: OmpA family protein [Bacteroidales bacterium]|nr:OmpA family protein [Bacteroidales bacterium]
MKTVYLNIILAVLLLGCEPLLISQDLHTKSNRALKAYLDGKTAYDFVDYAEAEKQLLLASQYDENFIEAFLLLAELYKDMKRYTGSLAAYRKVMQIDSLFFIHAMYSLAEVEFFTGDYNNSALHFRSYLRKQGITSALRQKANDYLLDCEFAMEAIKNPVPFHPVSLGDSINTRDDEYWPAITVDDKMLMFTRQTVRGAHNISGMTFQEDFYYSVRSDSVWRMAKSIGDPLNTVHNEGAQTLSAGGQYMYFTACNRIDGKGGCDIYYSTKTSRGWKPGLNLGNPINTQYWESQPSVSSDGLKLYFVSNRPGGFGGMDLWVSSLKKDGGWSEPENLGIEINTPGDEMSPFIHFDGKTIYFSSNGRPCMGGFDILISRLDEKGNWSKPENLGYPINTQADEIGMIINASGKIAYFSSEISSERGRDLFYFILPEEYRPDPVSYVNGTVYDKSTGRKLKASYELINLSTGEIVLKSFTGDDGSFLVCLNSGQNYGLNVNREQYLFYSENFMLEGIHSVTDPFEKRIALSPIGVGEKMPLFNVFFETDSWELRDESIFELNKLYELLLANSEVVVEIGGHTDSSGSDEHNLILSEKRAEVVRKFLIENGIESERLIFKGYGEGQPLSSNESEEGRRRNRRTEIKIIGIK